jgi:cobalamin biosynthesis protein CbiG
MAVKKGPKGSGDPFAKAAAKARKRFAESKKKKDEYGSGLKYDELEDGVYEARLVKARCGVTKAGDIYMALDFVLLDKELDGKQVDVIHSLKDDRGADSMCRTLKRLDYDVEKLEPEDIKEITADLNKSPPDVMLNIKNVAVAKDGTKLDEPRAYVNVQQVLGTADAAPAKPAKKKAAKKAAKK